LEVLSRRAKVGLTFGRHVEGTPFKQKTVSLAPQYSNGSYSFFQMSDNSLVNPGNHRSQSKMNNNTETIPWLVYRGIGLDVPEDEGPDEDEAETEDEDFVPVSRLRHIIRVRVDESVTALRANAFSYCIELREIQIPETVTSIGHHAFFHCSSLVTIQIPCELRIVEWNAFSLCHSLASIWLPDSVVSIGPNAFQRCTALRSVRLPVDIRRIRFCAFAECSTLATLEIPGSVIRIEQLAFSHCELLQAVRMSVSSNLSSIGGAAFGGCPLLTEIDVGTMAVNLWPRLLRQLGSRTGLFGNHTRIDQKKRRSFVLSFLKKHATQLCEGGTTERGRGIIRRTLAQQKWKHANA
jgi:hypothetical protein